MLNKPPKFSNAIFGANRRELQAFVEEVFRDKVVIQAKYDQLLERVKMLESLDAEKEDQLKQTSVALEGQGIALVSDLEHQKKKVAELQQEITDIRREKVALQAQLEQARLRIDELEAAQNRALNTDDANVEEFLDVRRRLTDAEKNLLEERQKLESIKLEKSYADSELSTARREIEILEAKLDSNSQFGMESDGLSGRIEALEAQVAERQRIIDELAGQISDGQNLNSVLDQMNSELDHLRAENAALKVGDERIIAELEAERDQLKTVLATSTNRESNDEALRSEIYRLHEELKNIHTSYSDQLRNVESEREEARTKLQAQGNDFHSENEKYTNEINRLQAELSGVHDGYAERIRNLETELEESRNQLHAQGHNFNSERENYSTQINRLQEEINGLQSGHSDRVRNLEAELEESRNQLHAQGHNFNSERESYSNETQNLKSDLHRLQEEINGIHTGYADRIRALEGERNSAFGQLHDERQRGESESNALQDQLRSIQNELNEALTWRQKWNESAFRVASLEAELKAMSDQSHTLKLEVGQLHAALKEDSKTRETLRETQIALETMRAGAERERLMILEAAHHHAEEIVARAQRRASEETWEVRKAQIERQRFFDSFRGLLQKYLSEIDQIRTGDLSQSISSEPIPIEKYSASSESKVDASTLIIPTSFAEHLSRSGKLDSDHESVNLNENVNWARRLKFVDVDATEPDQNIGAS